MRIPAAAILLATAALVATGCGSYSFTGTTLPPHVETIAIPVFEDQSRSGIPNLSDSITELMIDRFVNQTRLRLAANEIDAHTVLAGAVIRYRNQPAAVSAGEQATVNRVNITVRASYLDRTNGAAMVPERTFTAFGEYDPVEDGVEGENDAAVEALTQIADDLFTAATSNW